MVDQGSMQDIDFTVNQANLYREEGITDHKVASIRRLVPIKPDGTEDPDRSTVFYGSSQLMTPEGPLPLQAKLEATNMEEAMEEFPRAMQKALNETIEQLQKMQQQQQQQQQQQEQEKSRIYVPR